MNENPIPAVPPNFVQKPIRTYEGDIAEALGKKQVSVASIAIAENIRKVEIEKQTESTTQTETKSDKEKKPFNWLIIKKLALFVVSIALIGGGFVGGYLLYKRSPVGVAPVPEPRAIKISSLIPSDSQEYFDIGSMVGDSLISALHSNKKPSNVTARNIVETVVTDTISDNGIEPVKVRVTGSDFIKKVSLAMPDVILRSLTDRWMFGSYIEETGDRTTFIALTTDFFQNAYAGMLAWESTMPESLADLLKYRSRARILDNIYATSSISSYFNIQGTFTDSVLRNRDIREFRNRQGELLFLYSFLNKDLMVLTTTESAFLGIMDHIEKQTYLR
jgi:hypothetical protein